MSDKYIIKNCPAFAKGIFCKGGDIVDNGCADKTLDRNTLISCQDCTDCKMKQIVELCKDKMDTEFNSGSIFAEEILNLLQIEEIE